MEFIFTEPSGEPGEQSELTIWNSVKQTFANRLGIAYWRYPLFTDVESGGRGTHRKYKEPDILIVDRELGLVLIEVKGCLFEQIERINGQNWQMSSDFYARTIAPVPQVNRQAQDLLRYCNREYDLADCIPYRLLIGLPRINRQQWNDKFGRLPSAPSVVCNGESGSQLLEHIQNTAPRVQRTRLSDRQWRLLMGVIAGHVSEDDVQPWIDESLPLTEPSEISEITQRIDVVDRIESRLFELDLQQERIGKQIPPGPQRIRGIAGSGKTIVLCQRAAHLFLKHPDWDIAFIFFTRSLYEQVRSEVDRWLRRFSSDEVTLEMAKDKLRIFHAWGEEDEPGFYSTLRDRFNLPKLADKPVKGSHAENLAQNCKRILELKPPFEPQFNVILIDEGQDLMVSQNKYEDRQTIYWLAWQALRPLSPERPHLRRLYWAYDEFQSLENRIVPSFKELFGEKLAEQLVGKQSGPTYTGNILKNEVMKCCFRTPRTVLIAALTVGMGLLRENGRLYRFTRESMANIGFDVRGDLRSLGKIICLSRKPEHVSQLHWAIMALPLD